jgi:hypothetical protein
MYTRTDAYFWGPPQDTAYSHPIHKLLLRHEHLPFYPFILKRTLYEALQQMYVSTTAFRPPNNINT